MRSIVRNPLSMPIPIPVIRVVAGPVSVALTMDFTGLLPIPVKYSVSIPIPMGGPWNRGRKPRVP